MTTVILAGGKSRRLGEDKALVKVEGKPLIQMVIERVGCLFDNILVVSPTPSRLAFLQQARGVSLVQDAVPGKGPLGGIYTGLIRSRDRYNFICGCDMPFLNPGLVEFLFGIAWERDVDAVVPVVAGFPEPLHSIYSKKCLASVKDNLDKQELKVKVFFPQIRCAFIPEHLMRRYDPSLLSFFNLNTPKKLELCS